ncbi:glycosyltransferase [Verrucomicrobiales bacterium BCK34]|nr:glycosyltransferase [Verrucomicrobiales bacterium BCK34]
MMSVAILLLSILFLVCVGLLGHTYAVYPALLSLLAKGKKLPEAGFCDDADLPEVAVLMAVYNEEAVLKKTLQSILETNYPVEKVSVWIGSDGSTDRSHEIIESFRKDHPHLRLKIFAGRNGKIRIINQLAKEAAGEFQNPDTALFFLCDANVAWTPKLIHQLSRHFSREEIGFVGASVKDETRDRDGIGDEEEAYVGRENLIKFQEGVLWGQVIGAFGACYAMRANLFESVPENYIVDDYYLTVGCLAKGKKGIVDLEAVCYEAVSSDISEEFRRKRRIATGNFQNRRHFQNYFQPWGGGFAAWFAFWSHKGLRWYGPFLLAGAFLSSLALTVLAPLFAILPAGFLITFAVAGFDKWQSQKIDGKHVKIFRFIRYFYAMNAALFLGWIAYAKGVQNSVWEPTRREGARREDARREGSGNDESLSPVEL